MAETNVKRCIRCEQTKPTIEFHKHRETKDKLYPYCKACGTTANKLWRERNRERSNQNGYAWGRAHPEYRKNARKRYRKRYPERHAARNLEWYYKNKSVVSDRQKEYRKRLGDEAKLRRRAEYEKNAERYRKASNEWRLANPEKRKLNHLCREARKRSLPHTWTTEQMAAATMFWPKCPVCDKARTKTHWDHWIPLANPNCPGTVATNMLPLCPTCNMRKNDAMPEAWLRLMFPQSWQAILRRIELYFSEVSTSASLKPCNKANATATSGSV